MAKKNKNAKEWMSNFDKSQMTEKEIRNAEKYGNPRRLGFLRFMMIIMGLFPIYIILTAFLVTKDDIIVDLALINTFLDAIFYTVVFFMIWRRKKATRYIGAIVIGVDVVFTIVDLCIDLSYGVAGDAIGNAIFNTVINLLIIVYFLTSRRVKYALTQPLSSEKKLDDEKVEHYFLPKRWSFWRDLIIMFFIFSVVGHWMEFGYCTLIKIGILPGSVDPTNQIWSDFLFPFPIYGAGAVACALIFYPIKLQLDKKIKNKFVILLLVFVLSGIICSLMELAMGLATNADLKLWNYTNMFCNFMGQVCLQNSIGFALAATIMTYIVYPGIKNLFSKIEPAMNWVFVGVVAFGVLLFVFYYFNYLPEQIKQTNPEIYEEKFSLK